MTYQTQRSEAWAPSREATASRPGHNQRARTEGTAGKDKAGGEEITSLDNDALGVPGVDVPPEMVAKAADLLSVGEGLTSFLVSRAGAREPTPARRRDARLVFVDVVGGRRGREVVRVPLDVPVGELGGLLDEGAGAEGVRSVSLRNGQPVLPHQTLGDVGVSSGSTLRVSEPRPGVAAPVLAHGGPPGYPAQWRPVHRRSWAYLGAVTAAVAVGFFFAGGAVFGGAHGASDPAVAKLARSAAQAWMSGTLFSGPTGGDVGAQLDRRGPALAGDLEPAGSWSAPALFTEQFVVSGSAGTYGLSVVVYKGYVVYPPTPSPLPFVEPAGAQVPETGTGVKTNLAPSLGNWARATFVPNGGLRSAGLTLAGPVQVLNEWQPRSGASLVARVQVPLAGAHGTAAYGVYDVAFGRQGHIAAWAPAGYGA